MLEKMLAAGGAGLITALIAVLIQKHQDKKRNKGNYLGKKLKQYFKKTKEILSFYISNQDVKEIQTYILNYLYELKSGHKKYYEKTHGIFTDALVHKNLEKDYYKFLLENYKNNDIVQMWTLIMINDRLKKAPQSDTMTRLQKKIDEMLSEIDTTSAPACFDILKTKL